MSEINLEERLEELKNQGYAVQELIDALRKPDLSRFHLKDGRGNPKGVYDVAIFNHLCEEMDLFILGGVPWIYEGGAYRADVSGAVLKSRIRELILPEFIKSTTIKRVYDLFISAAELQATYEDLNAYPASWICFRNGFYDPISRKMIPHDPRYKAVNQLPHEFDPEAHPDGKAVEAWLQFIVPEPQDREMLLEFAGYCMTRDTRQQKFLILSGEGGTGKSTLIRLIELMIGTDNISSISLGELSQRFAAFGLLGKLLNSCADLELAALEDVSILKKLLGEDQIRGEAKGKDAFPFRSFAKLIFSTNQLPVVKGEMTAGFYRRLLVLEMNRKPAVRRPDLFDELAKGLPYFIQICVEALSRMYERGTILSSDHSAEAVARLRRESDTVAAFLHDCAVRKHDGRLERGYLFEKYLAFCYEVERQHLTKSNFFKSLRLKGISEVKTGGNWFFEGLALKE